MCVSRRRAARNVRLTEALYREPNRPCFVTIRAAGRANPFLEPALNDAIIAVLATEGRRHRCAVYTYCLMPDHLHVVCAPRDPDESVIVFLDRFKSASTRVAWRHGVLGRLWQPRFYDHVVRLEESLAAICEYVLANPQRAQLVRAGERYRWAGMLDPIP